MFCLVVYLVNGNFLFAANPNHKTIEGEGQYPIHFAAKYNATHCIEYLVSIGCNPNQRDDMLRTPLYVAAEYG